MSHPTEGNQSQEIRPLSLSWALLWARTLHGILGEELVRNRQKAVSVYLFSKLTAHWIPRELQNMLILCPTCWDPGSGCDLGIGRLKSFSDDPKVQPWLGPTALKGQYSLEVLVYGLRQEVWEKRCPSTLQVGTWIRWERHLPWAVSKGWWWKHSKI